MAGFTRRALLVGGGAAAGAMATHFLGRETIGVGAGLPVTPADVPGDILNDASQLSPTRVSKHLVLADDRKDALIETVRRELAEAKAAGRPVVPSAARHSMGGQSLHSGGTALTLDRGWLDVDQAAGTCRVSAGMRWSEVITRLDAIGFSPKVMQSNHDFGVASTFSVNAHGWPVPWSAFGSTVRSITMLLPDGGMVICSRQENPELFNLAMGGYGLFGVIVELEIEIVPNRNLAPTFDHVAGEELGLRFMQALSADKTIEMAYGRLDVAIDGFFERGLLITYRPTEDQTDIPAASGSGIISHIAAGVFRRQVGSDRVKNFRWMLESAISPALTSGVATRNSLMNEPVITLDDGDPGRTDILHEYFVAPERFADFVRICREVIPSSYQELLNITLRFVDTDRDSVLAYATVPRICAVMLFSQEMSVRGEEDMARMTRALVDRVTEIGGSYYLPYRPHPTLDQLRRAYPRADEFAAAKRRLDPGLLLQNGLWTNYISRI